MRLLPRAPLTSVIAGSHPLVGSRTGAVPQRGWISPIEARALMGQESEDLCEVERGYLASPERTWRSDASVVLRALVARVIAPLGAPSSARRLRVVCADVDNVTFSDVLDWIFAPAREDRARFVHFAHAHLLNLAYRDEQLRLSLARADLTLPDGVGVRLAARMRRVVLRQNVNGTDLFPLLCRRASVEGVPLVLVGAREAVIAACVSRMQRELPDVTVAFASHGYLDDAQSRVVAERVRALGRVVVLVGMGSPRQELWAWQHLVDAREATVLTVGGLFDMYSGQIPRAPLQWRELGLEWAWRLGMEPRRMAVRYLVGNPLFLARALASALTHP